MPIQREHISLPECRPCVVLKQDTYAGVISTAGVNNVQMSIKNPIAFFQALQKELNDKLHQRYPKSNYTVSIQVNPKDHRSFLSATFKYGRRLLTYTNVSSIPNNRTKENNTFCIKQTYITATRTYKIAGNGKKWVEQCEAKWKKAGYRGGFIPRETAKGTIYTGNFDHSQEDKHVKVTSLRPNTRYITFTLVQTVNVFENINSDTKPQYWVRDIDREMKTNKFQGEINTHVNSFNKLIIDGRYTKTIKVDKNGTNAYIVTFTNQKERFKSTPIEDPNTWRPTKKIGKTYAQVRSIAQDDTYTPEFQGKKINWERIEIDKLYREYLQMPENELETRNKHLEDMEKRAATKGQKAALKWLRHVRNSKPQWLQAPNAFNLANYCVKYIEREVMTPSEASMFCKRNAYNNNL